jgi:LPXTG-motif cell wall-anchored protein
MNGGGNLPSESGALKSIEPVPWRGVRAAEKLVLILLPLSAAVVLILPFLDQVILRRLARLPGARPFVTWLINDSNTWLVGAGLLLLGGLFMLLVRHRLNSNKQLWFGTGCPQCMERELVRVTRNSSDRLYGLIGVPAYRYACRNCTWRGLRIARREHSPEHEAELEASLLRFDPDGVPPVRPPAEVNATLPIEIDSMPDPDIVERLAEEVDPTDEIDPVADDQSADAEPMMPEPGIESPESVNNHADAKALDGMEWLWRRSSDA